MAYQRVSISASPSSGTVQTVSIPSPSSGAASTPHKDDTKYPLLFSVTFQIRQTISRMSRLLNSRVYYQMPNSDESGNSHSFFVDRDAHSTTCCKGIVRLEEDEEDIATSKKRDQQVGDSTGPAGVVPSSPRRGSHGQAKVHSLYLLCLDVSKLTPTVRTVVLIGGLVLFMCLYGYFQELVVYSWFDKKLSVFATFLHFMGCTLFGLLQKRASSNSSLSVREESTSAPSTSSKSDKSNSSFWSWLPSMGTANARTSLFYYAALVLLKTLSQALSNLSMSQINYPAKVLFKSANPVVTMFIGVLYLQKSYPLRDYIVVVLLLAGLYLFIAADQYDGTTDSSMAMPSATGMGLIYVSLSMVTGASVPMLQEHVIALYNASVDDLLFFSFLGGALLSLGLSAFNGELWAGLIFLSQSLSFSKAFIFIAFCSFSFLGATCSTGITAQHGALVNGICNTFRKATTIALSFFLFPDRNHLSLHKVEGIVVFFAGLALRVFFKSQSHSHTGHHQAHRSQSFSDKQRTTAVPIANSASERNEMRLGVIDEESGLAVSISSDNERGLSGTDNDDDIAERENDEDMDVIDENDAVRGFSLHSSLMGIDRER